MQGACQHSLLRMLDVAHNRKGSAETYLCIKAYRLFSSYFKMQPRLAARWSCIVPSLAAMQV